MMIGEAVPVFGMLTGLGVTAVAVLGFVRFMQGPVGQAFARRIQGQTGEAETSAEVAQLREELDNLRRQLEETQERVDFAERLLSQQRAAPRLPEAGG